jgi:phenylpropionate dioxygenase-like ring-hydroxylating dioxygenase large terminal subunit
MEWMDRDPLRGYWQPVARVDSLGDGPVSARLLDEDLVVVRLGDEISVFQDLCIHRGTPLSLGWVDGDRLVCGYHGWEYVADGRCARIPSLPDGRHIPTKARVLAYPHAVRYGLVWACLDEPVAPLPEFPEYDQPGFATRMVGPYPYKANAARVTENSMDYTHFPWVHDGLLGDRTRPVYPEVTPVVEDTSLRYAVRDDRNGTIRNYRLFLPFTLNIRVERQDPTNDRRYSMLFACAATSARESVLWFIESRNWSVEAEDAGREEFDRLVRQQDQQIVERQKPELLPLDLTEELHLRGTDAGALEYRRLLRRVGVSWVA